LLVRATYIYGVVLHALPVRGESQIQRNTTGEVATVHKILVWAVKGPQEILPLLTSVWPFHVSDKACGFKRKFCCKVVVKYI